MEASLNSERVASRPVYRARPTHSNFHTIPISVARTEKKAPPPCTDSARVWPLPRTTRDAALRTTSARSGGRTVA